MRRPANRSPWRASNRNPMTEADQINGDHPKVRGEQRGNDGSVEIRPGRLSAGEGQQGTGVSDGVVPDPDAVDVDVDRVYVKSARPVKRSPGVRSTSCNQQARPRRRWHQESSTMFNHMGAGHGLSSNAAVYWQRWGSQREQVHRIPKCIETSGLDLVT